jgi:hypothetical protein
VYERYLFRQEKELRQTVESEQIKSILAIELFHSTLASLSEIVTSSISMVVNNLDRYEEELLPLVPPEHQPSLRKGIARMRQDYSLVSSATRSVFQMANRLHANVSHEAHTAEFSKSLEEYRRAAQTSLMELQQHTSR